MPTFPEMSGAIQVLPSGLNTIYSSPFPVQAGTRARDVQGNEYVFCSFSATVYFGCVVQIDSKHSAAPLLGTASRPFRVGVVMGGDGTSVNHHTSTTAGWVQVYGLHPAVQTGVASDGGVSATAGGNYWCIPQTSVGTPTGTLALIAQGAGTSIAQSSVDGNRINNMWVVDLGEVTDLTTYWGVSGASGPSSINYLREGDSGTSGAATSAFIGQSYACFLNYPYVTGITVPLSDATT